LPLALPAVVSLCILDGVATWNEFILAQIFFAFGRAADAGVGVSGQPTGAPER